MAKVKTIETIKDKEIKDLEEEIDELKKIIIIKDILILCLFILIFILRLKFFFIG